MMGEIFDEDARVELIEGEIVDMVPIGPKHQEFVNRLTRLCFIRWDKHAVVQVQGPIQLSDHSVVQPDIALLKKKSGGYADAHPRPSDILLVVEVSDTTLARDLEKAKLYAASGVKQCWILDVNKRELITMSSPTPERYTTQHIVSVNESFADPVEKIEYLDSSDIFGPSI